MKVAVILPNQLFEDNIVIKESDLIYLVEDPIFFTKYPYHKLKLAYHRATMNYYYNFIIRKYSNKNIKYIEFSKVNYDKFFENASHINLYYTLDHSLTFLFNNIASKFNLEITFYDTPLFIETYQDLYDFKMEYGTDTKPFRYNHDLQFYRYQRRKLDILMDKNKPLYNKWSFDKENRSPFINYDEPPKPKIIENDYIIEAVKYINKHFSSNVGSLDYWIYPITFENSKKWLRNFIINKLSSFGKFEDAISPDIDFGSHSLLSPMLNIGLITVRDVVDEVLDFFDNLTPSMKKKEINNVEAFIRQIIGWRSYVRFIYEFYSEYLFTENLFKNKNKIPDKWYLLEIEPRTDTEPLYVMFDKINKYGYLHHIERLMIVGNIFLLYQFDPLEVYKWFMIMFIDAYEWVMVGNIFGMSQHSSENVKMMTRPYFSSSNYIIKMSSKGYKNHKWADEMDILYYNFIGENKEYLRKIYATSRNVYHYDKKTYKQKEQIEKEAKKIIKQLYE